MDQDKCIFFLFKKRNTIDFYLNGWIKKKPRKKKQTHHKLTKSVARYNVTLSGDADASIPFNFLSFLVIFASNAYAPENSIQLI